VQGERGAAPPSDCGPHAVVRALTELAELEYRLGDWPAAHLTAVEALRAATSAGLDEEVMSALVCLARVEAGVGRAEACRSHAAQAIELSRRHGSLAVEATAGEAVGRLELGLGAIDRAIERLERVALICSEDSSAQQIAVTWAEDLAEACIRRGDRVGARRAVKNLEQRASRSGSCALVAALARSLGLVATEESFENHFQRSLAWAARAGQPFDEARTVLCYGERLRRAGRRGESRPLLAGALRTFESLGSEPWAARAREELAASEGADESCPAREWDRQAWPDGGLRSHQRRRSHAST
jgi:tetratricopeptide (TPR) repeat protein